jgi:nucleoside-diphosphate-sugar epimerase
MKKISILGCGWLGLPLAKKLLSNNFEVSGSTTSDHKLPILAELGIKPFLIAITENEIIGDFQSFIGDSEILIIDIPPKLRSNSKENFVAKIQNTIAEVEKSTTSKIIFVSSTSVYADDNSVVSEETICVTDTEGGKQLLQSEQILKNNKNFKTTILRFGGLIGDDRHPIYFLAGRTNIENPYGPINLIHQNDCIAIIIAVIKQGLWNETFNAVAPFHEKRKEYYTKKAVALGLALPHFATDKESVGKTISSRKIIEKLDFEFTKV